MTTGSVRRENTEEGKQGEGSMPNADVENTEDERCPIERGTDQQQQQHDNVATYKIMEISSTSEENQYAEGKSDRESDTEMVIDTQRDSTEDLSHKSKEQDPVSKPPSIQDGDRDIEKPGRKQINQIIQIMTNGLEKKTTIVELK